MARARNNFVHCEWPTHSEQEHEAHRAEGTVIAREAPRIFAALHELEDSIVFDGQRKRLDRVLEEMELFDVRTRGQPGQTDACRCVEAVRDAMCVFPRICACVSDRICRGIGIIVPAVRPIICPARHT
ncbi:MAG: hypothetical protein M3237_11710, partial [Actinomycetota bacterium]|nr:hypothetical protein [Actinomycetota bacterium]